MPVGGLHLATSSSKGFVVICYSKRKQDVKKPKKSELAEEKKKLEGKKEEQAPPPPRITDTGSRSLKSHLRIVRSIQAEKRQEEQAKRSKYSKPREIKPPARVGAEAIRPKRILRPELNKSKQEKKEKPLTEEELAAKAAKEKAIARNRKIAGLYHKRCLNGTQAALIIDGYNVMLQWIEEPGQCQLKKTIGGNFDAVRSAFLQEVSAYSSKDLRVMVAFDAIGNLSAPPIAREVFGGIETVFVSCSEADAFISTEAVNLRKAGCPYVLVASNDHDVSEACWSDEIFPMSSMQLLHEIRKEKKAYERQQAEKALKAGGQGLGSRMMASSPQLFMKFERMRRGQQKRS